MVSLSSRINKRYTPHFGMCFWFQTSFMNLRNLFLNSVRGYTVFKSSASIWNDALLFLSFLGVFFIGFLTFSSLGLSLHSFRDRLCKDWLYITMFYFPGHFQVSVSGRKCDSKYFEDRDISCLGFDCMMLRGFFIFIHILTRVCTRGYNTWQKVRDWKKI